MRNAIIFSGFWGDLQKKRPSHLNASIIYDIWGYLQISILGFRRWSEICLGEGETKILRGQLPPPPRNVPDLLRRPLQSIKESTTNKNISGIYGYITVEFANPYILLF